MVGTLNVFIRNYFGGPVWGRADCQRYELATGLWEGTGKSLSEGRFWHINGAEPGCERGPGPNRTIIYKYFSKELFFVNSLLKFLYYLAALMPSSFSRASWVPATNIYEVNLRQYTPEGNFSAFMKEIPRLRDMGVEVLWFMPITPIGLEKRKGTLGSYYACSDYMAINPEYGTLDDFKQVVRVAHEQGCRVIIDWVANHTAWDHRWTREHPDFYRKDGGGNFFEAHGWEDVIDLNYDNPALRVAMINAMSFWIRECDIDGFRCDMAMLVPLDFWRQARTELDRQKELFWLAECEEIPYHEVFDASYTWKCLHKMEAVWRKESSLPGLDEVLQYYDSMFPVDAIRAYFTSNHDENSHSGSEYERMGNAARAFAVFCCTWNGIPLIYSGQELPNYKRLQFFDRDPIGWKHENGANSAGWGSDYQLHTFYKALLSLRKRNPALRGGDLSVATYRLNTGADDKCFAFVRRTGNSEVVVLLNISEGAITIPAGGLKMKGAYYDVFADQQIDFSIPGKMDIPAWGYKVFEKK